MMAPPQGSIIDGFLKINYEEKSEAEQELGISISSDGSLWESNAFVKYQEDEWKQKAVEKVVLLFTYLALNSFAKLRVRFTQYGFNEFADLPWGSQDQNTWIVHGYVDATSRVVRSRDGQSIGQWYLQSLEPDATADLLKYKMLPGNGGSFIISFERA